MVQVEHVPVGVAEERLMADARVDRLAHELDPARLELGASGGDIVDVERDRHPVRAELDAQPFANDESDRDGARLELGADRVLTVVRPQTGPRSSPTTFA